MLIPSWRPLSILGFRPTGDLAGLTCYSTKKNKKVWFPKSPPEKPPSPRQIAQRSKFKLVGRLWRNLPDADRAQWRLAERRGSLVITGYNLFLWYHLGGDPNIIRTIQRQTDTNLIP